LDKEAHKIKARRLPRFEALIPDELTGALTWKMGAWSGISPSGPSGGLLAGERCDRSEQLNTVKLIVRL
jgi:hypothetical protein